LNIGGDGLSIDTRRAGARAQLLTTGAVGNDIWVALAWSVGILVVSYTLALNVYRRNEPVPVGQ
jgi:hypothetical protein